MWGGGGISKRRGEIPIVREAQERETRERGEEYIRGGKDKGRGGGGGISKRRGEGKKEHVTFP